MYLIRQQYNSGNLLCTHLREAGAGAGRYGGHALGSKIATVLLSTRVPATRNPPIYSRAKYYNTTLLWQRRWHPLSLSAGQGMLYFLV